MKIRYPSFQLDHDCPAKYPLCILGSWYFLSATERRSTDGGEGISEQPQVVDRWSFPWCRAGVGETQQSEIGMPLQRRDSMAHCQ
jgi:hypothetical protein